MKHTNLILFCITFLPFTLFSMHEYIELLPIEMLNTRSTIPLTVIKNSKDIVKIIDKAINKQYPQSNPLAHLFSTLTLSEKDMFTIISIPGQCCKKTISLTTSLLDAIYDKNDFFSKAIDYFGTFARKNVDNVTCNTLDTVDNPKSSQPIQELNSLPLPIKEYVMQLARDESKLDYEMTLEHSDAVNLFCICPTTHIIVTHSTHKKLRLWDLKTGLYVASFPENNYIHTMCFNADGSQLATVSYYIDTNMSHIKIWEPQSQKLLYIIKQSHFAYYIDFTQKASSSVLTVFTQKPHDHREKALTLWLFNENAKPTLLGRTSPLQWIGEQLTNIDAPYKKDYDGYFHSHDRSTLYILKKYCPELYLCKQAIENSSHPEILNNINLSQPYSRLTTYEKHMINKQVAKKAATLAALQNK